MWFLSLNWTWTATWYVYATTHKEYAMGSGVRPLPPLYKSFQPESFLFCFFFFSISFFSSLPPFLPSSFPPSLFQLWRWLDNVRLQHLSVTWGCHPGVLQKRLYFLFPRLTWPLLALTMGGALELVWQGAFSVLVSHKEMDPPIHSALWHFLYNSTAGYSFPSWNQFLNALQC